jgi:hypothetical protein
MVLRGRAFVEEIRINTVINEAPEKVHFLLPFCHVRPQIPSPLQDSTTMYYLGSREQPY